MLKNVKWNDVNKVSVGADYIYDPLIEMKYIFRLVGLVQKFLLVF